jgi:hypothetical protein
MAFAARLGRQPLDEARQRGVQELIRDGRELDELLQDDPGARAQILEELRGCPPGDGTRRGDQGGDVFLGDCSPRSGRSFGAFSIQLSR